MTDLKNNGSTQVILVDPAEELSYVIQHIQLNIPLDTISNVLACYNRQDLESNGNPETYYGVICKETNTHLSHVVHIFDVQLAFLETLGLVIRPVG